MAVLITRRSGDQECYPVANVLTLPDAYQLRNALIAKAVGKTRKSASNIQRKAVR